MPEIKHTFSGGKMNKDLDERLVPNGEYRHAMNVQVRTTSGDTDGVGDAGVVQNIQGNSIIGSSFLQSPYVPILSNPNETTVVGSIANERTNKYYFFIAGLRLEDIDLSNIASKRIFLDTIMEVTVGTSVTNTASNPVVVDKYAVVDSVSNVMSSGQLSYAQNAGSTSLFFVQDTSDLRVGMKFIPLSSSGNNLWSGGKEPVISEILTNQQIVLSSNVQLANNWDIVQGFLFEAPRVLNFKNDKKITAINVIDDLLFWTDGLTEPKKINIKRCKEGTADLTSHTQLKLSDPYDDSELLDYVGEDGLEVSLSPGVNNDLREEHITVKREAPRMAPTLQMRDTLRQGQTSFTLDLSGTLNVTTIGSNGGLLQQGDTLIISTAEGFSTENVNQIANLDLEINDVLNFQEDLGPYSPSFNASIQIGTNLTSVNPVLVLNILSVSTILNSPLVGIDGSGIWNVSLDEKKPLFESKFARFGLRYKYEDGEYSSFGPWSELAFLPGEFDYDHRKGYNLGMVNNVRELYIEDFIPHQRVKPNDVVSVDILYKTTDSPNVYVVKTITRGKDPEWDLFYPSNVNSQMIFGRLKITSEIIHRAVDKNQILRSWDNVPRYAAAQELAANRLIYANYTQGYNIKDMVGLVQDHVAEQLVYDGNPVKSIKSIRDYKFGMVFGDKYGRETPVIAPGYISGENLLSGDVRIEKEFASYQNKFQVQQVWSNAINNGVPEDWMEYVKYFVKETSSEYYNLIMDKWYDADDGNIWLSFNSADRNKIDEETYLILKNEHGSNAPVPEIARYKIIAIESEAPEFVKLDPRFMGERQINDSGELFELGSFNTATDSPTRLMGNEREMTLTAASGWNNMMGGHLVLGQAKGTVKIRINAQNQNTGTKLNGGMWNTLTYISQNMDGTEGTFRWKEPFLETVDFVDKFTAAGEVITGITYFIEFKEFVPDNKPEFDGKFFVKVERDTVLENRVLKYNQAQLDWDSVGTYFLSYINPTRDQNPANTVGNVFGLGPDRTLYEWMDTAGSDGVAAQGTSGPNMNPNGTNIADAISFGTSSEMDAMIGANTTGDDGNFGLGGWGSGSQDQGENTRAYWEQVNTVFHPRLWSKIFVDQAPARTFRIFGSGCGNRNWLDANNDPVGTFGSGMDPIINYMPTGFDKGWLTYAGQQGSLVNPTQDGHFGRVALSMIPNMGPAMTYLAGSGSFSVFNNDSGQNYKEYDFFKKMCTEGTYFRFTYDDTGPPDENGNPQGNLYRIVSRGGGPFTGNSGGDIDYWGVGGDGYDVNDGSASYVYNYAGGEALSYGSQIGSDYGGSGFESSTSLWGDGGAGYSSWYTSGFNQINSGSTYFGVFYGSNNADWDNFDASDWGPGTFDCNDFIPWSSGENITEALTGGNSGSNGFGCNPALDPYCSREGVRVEFRRCNEDGSLMGSGNVGVDPNVFDPRATTCHDGREAGIHIRFYQKAQFDPEKLIPVGDAAVWETEPKEDVGLDIYYEASNAIPMFLTPENTLDFAPYQSKVSLKNATGESFVTLLSNFTDHHVALVGYTEEYPVIGVKSTSTDDGISGYHAFITNFNIGQNLVFTHKDGTQTQARIINHMSPVNDNGDEIPFTELSNGLYNFSGVTPMDEPAFVQSTQGKTGFFAIDPEVYSNPVLLSWFNCYSFKNGLESDRIRDDFNTMTIDNGVKVSSTFLDYGEEYKGSGMIYSGIYNSISGVNNLNEFNMAEKITKDLNPSYGSIQVLKTRDTSLVAFCEDKILQITTNKDALFNADGNAQLLASNRVLGTAIPFAGDYGISKNPESLAWDQFRYYFSDTQRGSVLRLSQDGLTPISSIGMKTWFRDNLPKTKQVIGTFDTVNDEYNITLKYKYSQNKEDETVSFAEDSQGWVSFKSFMPESGGSVGGKYITAVKNTIWEHYVDITDNNALSSNFGKVINRNTFYPTEPYNIENMSSYFTPSSLIVLFNDAPSTVKSFQALNYEGSQARVVRFTDGQDTGQVYQPDGTTVFQMPYTSTYNSGIGGIGVGDGEYYNLHSKNGWWVESITTDLNFSGVVSEFKNKEGKWFNHIDSKERGELKEGNLEEFSVQGIGMIKATDTTPQENPDITITLTSDNVNNPQNPAGLGNPDPGEENE